MRISIKDYQKLKAKAWIYFVLMIIAFIAYLLK